LKVNRCFGGICHLHLQGRRIRQARTLFATCLHAGFLLGLFFDPEDGGSIFIPKRPLTFNGLHGVISQKIYLFIITAGRTSNLTKCKACFMFLGNQNYRYNYSFLRIIERMRSLPHPGKKFLNVLIKVGSHDLRFSILVLPGVRMCRF
jgi:hypothetical protein